MTEMLYYEDPHRTEFEARVVATEPAGTEGTGRVWVELDRTCFYPEGGGQPADRGRIGDEVVLDVQKTDGRILHLVEPGGDDPRGDGAGGDATGAPGGGPPLEAGAAVRGRVDARMRRDYMQQHTGQHIISAAMIEIGGYETISVHQGEEYTSVDFAAADIPAADLERAEARANAVVGENRPVKTFYTESSEAASLGLRRPPKFEGTLRIVEVEGIDRVACGGVHCERTGEVGMIKLIGTDRIRGNVRTFWKIGDRALADYRLKTEICNTLVDTFSAKVPELPARAEKLEANLKQAEWEIGRLQKRLAAELAERLAAGADTPGRHPVVTHHFDGEAKELFRAVAEDLAARAGLAACLTNEVDGRLQWIITAGEGVDLDFARVRGELLPLIDGKGGGKPPIWQGVGEAPQGASAFAAAFDALLAGSGPEGA